MFTSFKRLFRDLRNEAEIPGTTEHADRRLVERDIPKPENANTERPGSNPKLSNDNDAPLPLSRSEGEAADFPHDALTGHMAAGVEAIMEHAKVPGAMAANSVLAALATVVQAHRLIEIPATRSHRPCSLIMVTVAESSARKTTADSLATRSLLEFERKLEASYRQQQAESHMPSRSRFGLPGPPKPEIMIQEGTHEGVCRTLAEGIGYCLLNNDEFATQLFGPGMTAENKLRFTGGQTKFWDGTPVKRKRSGSTGSDVVGKALSVHWQMQPCFVPDFHGDPALKGQGILSRCLSAWPKSLVGTRLLDVDNPGPSALAREQLTQFIDHLAMLLEYPVRYVGDTFQLDRVPLVLSPSAERLWARFHNEIESKLKKDYASIEEFAGKAGEHVLRLAVVLKGSQNLEAPDVTPDDLDRAVALTRFYLCEAQRLMGLSAVQKDLGDAQKLLGWLQNDWKKGNLISSPDIYQYGPPHVRDKRRATTLCGILREHGWLVQVPGRHEINGKMRRECWRIVRQ